jgi:hypothetical protein
VASAWTDHPFGSPAQRGRGSRRLRWPEVLNACRSQYRRR